MPSVFERKTQPHIDKSLVAQLLHMENIFLWWSENRESDSKIYCKFVNNNVLFIELMYKSNFTIVQFVHHQEKGKWGEIQPFGFWKYFDKCSYTNNWFFQTWEKRNTTFYISLYCRACYCHLNMDKVMGTFFRGESTLFSVVIDSRTQMLSIELQLYWTQNIPSKTFFSHWSCDTLDSILWKEEHEQHQEVKVVCKCYESFWEHHNSLVLLSRDWMDLWTESCFMFFVETEVGSSQHISGFIFMHHLIFNGVCKCLL